MLYVCVCVCVCVCVTCMWSVLISVQCSCMYTADVHPIHLQSIFAPIHVLYILYIITRTSSLPLQYLTFQEIRKVRAPTLFLSGLADQLIPPRMMMELYQVRDRSSLRRAPPGGRCLHWSVTSQHDVWACHFVSLEDWPICFFGGVGLLSLLKLVHVFILRGRPQGEESIVELYTCT